MKIENICYIKNIKIQPAIENISEVIGINQNNKHFITKPFAIAAELYYSHQPVPENSSTGFNFTAVTHQEMNSEPLRIQTVLHIPTFSSNTPKGIALIAHPHPLYGGSMDNKIVQTLIKTLNELGYIAIRFNFRGVGSSNGLHDNGISEIEDAMKVFKYLDNDAVLLLKKWGLEIDLKNWQSLPIVLGGFSFGTYVISHLQNHIDFPRARLKKTLMIGTAAKKWDIAPVGIDSLIMHGNDDDVIPLKDVQEWCQIHQLKLEIIENAGHYFHGKLANIKQAVLNILA